MHIDRALIREARRQHAMKLRLAQALARTGFTLPERIPVTLEQLQEVHRQLLSHFAQQAPDRSALN